MKRLFSLILLFIVIFPLFSNGTIEFNYEIGDFDKIIEKTNEVVDDVKDISEDFVVKNTRIINNNLEIVKRQLSNEKNFWGIEKSESKKLDEYLAGLKKIVSFYNDICSNEPKIRNKLTTDVNKLYALSINMENILHNERKKLLSLTKERNTYEQKITTQDYSLEINSLDQQINYCRIRIKMLEHFFEKFSSLEPKLNEILRTVDNFCNTIKESQKVFQAAFDTVKLSKEINSSFLIQYDMSELDNLSIDIQESWNDLDYIISDLVLSLET